MSVGESKLEDCELNDSGSTLLRSGDLIRGGGGGLKAESIVSKKLLVFVLEGTGR